VRVFFTHNTLATVLVTFPFRLSVRIAQNELNLMPTSHRRLRRNETVEFRRVVGAIESARQSATVSNSAVADETEVGR